MLKCVGCDYEVDNKAENCPVCNQPPAGHPCNVCKRRIPDKAKVCNTCKSYQTQWWRFLVKAGTFLLSAGAVAAIANNIGNLASALNHSSNTHVKLLTKTDAEAIQVKVLNSGQQASWIIAARLKFENSPVAPVDLELACCPLGEIPSLGKEREAATNGCETTNLVKGGEAVTICLTSGPITFHKPGTNGAPYPKPEALKLLQHHKVTLEVEIEESNDPGLFGLRPHHVRTDTFDESLVHGFLEVL
jgi:RNA polymerase subunit RPABC4/transcription elongation factor Spt4